MRLDEHKLVRITGGDSAHLELTLDGKPLPYVLGANLEGIDGLVVAQVEMVAVVDVCASYDLEQVAGAIMQTRGVRVGLDPAGDLEPLPTLESVFIRAATFPPIEGFPVPLVRVESPEAAALLRVSLPDPTKIRLRWTSARRLVLTRKERWPVVELVLVTPPTKDRPWKDQQAQRVAYAEMEQELWRLLGDRSE